MQKKGSGRRLMSGHMLMMLLCCVIAIGALGYWFFGPRTGTGSYGILFMVLLCPLMHLFMMGSHGHQHGEKECHSEENRVMERKHN